MGAWAPGNLLVHLGGGESRQSRGSFLTDSVASSLLELVVDWRVRTVDWRDGGPGASRHSATELCSTNNLEKR